MSKPSFIEPMLVCSTGNVTRPTMERITDGEANVTAYPNEYGAFIHVPEDSEHDEDDGGIPDDLRPIFALAREYDCCWIKLDRDADVIGDLPHYDW